MSQFNYRRQRDAGFTLIELLIVIIVLGLLTAIVLFALGTFKQDSAVAACKADVKQVKTAETAYFIKHNDYTIDLGTLVSDNFLQSQPGTDNYTITAHADGSVTSNLSGCGD